MRQKKKIIVAATFTADLIEESLAFWMQNLLLSYDIEFAPYNSHQSFESRVLCLKS